MAKEWVLPKQRMPANPSLSDVSRSNARPRAVSASCTASMGRDGVNPQSPGRRSAVRWFLPRQKAHLGRSAIGVTTLAGGIAEIPGAASEKVAPEPASRRSAARRGAQISAAPGPSASALWELRKVPVTLAKASPWHALRRRRPAARAGAHASAVFWNWLSACGNCGNSR